MLNSIVAVTAVIAFAFGIFVFGGISSAVIPLVSLVVLVDTGAVFAMMGMLKPGIIIAYIIAAAVFGAAVYKARTDIPGKVKEFFSPGVVLFIISSAVMLIILSATQPVMHGWDEFSFWGTSQKLVYSREALYTYYSSSMLGQSIPPSMAVLTYFFGGFALQFTEWVCYYAYDVLFFACFGAFTAAFGRKQPHSAFMLFTAAFTIPFLFEITEINSKLYSTYISAYADIPLGLVFAGAVAVYIYSQENNSRDILPVLPVLMFLTLIKDMGFALGCIVAFIIFFDMWIGKKEFSFIKIKGFFGKCFGAAAMLAVTAGSYIAWSMHISRVLTIDRSDFGGSSGMGMVEMLISGVKGLLGIDRSKKFTQIFSSMISAFFNIKVSMFGSGLIVVAIITAVFAVAFVLGSKNSRKRTFMMYITSWISFIGYYIFHLFLYVYVFRNDAYALPSYDRYMYTFYIGWLCMGLFCLALAVREGIKLPAKAALFAFTIGCLAVFSFYADSGNTFIGVSTNSFPKRELISRKADFLRDAIGEDDVIYIGSEDNSGEHWFIYTYELIDNYIVPDYFVWDGNATEDEWDLMARDMMCDYFRKNNVTHFLIDNVNEEFIFRYGDLFDVPVDEIGLNYVAYYKVNYTDEGFTFSFVKGGAA
ncbi:MAG: hypothetical protein IJD80_00535 [Oscillospiraceae bacterium]|nr:hypothetical protein [Oscillospiraceae bacterium]